MKSVVRESGTFFLDKRMSGVKTLEKVQPQFFIGSMKGPSVANHMIGDFSHFELIRELVLAGGSTEGKLALDIGANQGFYTYFLAALGLEVHAFEISQDNFIALQHGTEYNSKEVSEKVHLYPIGLGEKNARFGMSSGDYTGFLKEGNNSPILGLSFDCFAYQNGLDISHIAFIKLDVEGFEIAVLRGAHKSLFQYSKIGGMLMEVGPNRWNRANIGLSDGIQEMKQLATHFQTSYVLLRTGGVFAKSCPTSLGDQLADKSPIKKPGILIFQIQPNEWEPILVELEKIKGDCNFFYKN